MPALPALREITAAARNDNIKDNQAAHRIGMRRRQCIGRRAAPVMANQKEGVIAEHFMDQAPNIIGNRAFVIAGKGPRTVSKASHVRGDHGVFFGQRRDHVSPLPPRLRPTMQQHDGRPRARCHIVQHHLAQIGVMVGNLRKYAHGPPPPGATDQPVIVEA